MTTFITTNIYVNGNLLGAYDVHSSLLDDETVLLGAVLSIVPGAYSATATRSLRKLAHGGHPASTDTSGIYIRAKQDKPVKQVKPVAPKPVVAAEKPVAPKPAATEKPVTPKQPVAPRPEPDQQHKADLAPADKRKVSQLQNLTGLSAQKAQALLRQNGWNVTAATRSCFVGK